MIFQEQVQTGDNRVGGVMQLYFLFCRRPLGTLADEVNQVATIWWEVPFGPATGMYTGHDFLLSTDRVFGCILQNLDLYTYYT